MRKRGLSLSRPHDYTIRQKHNYKNYPAKNIFVSTLGLDTDIITKRYKKNPEKRNKEDSFYKR